MPLRSLMPADSLMLAARSCRRLAEATGEEDQLEPADLHLVAVREGTLVDTLAVDVGAVERSDVTHRVRVAGPHELRVATADGDVVEKDVAVRMTAGGAHDLFEHQLGAGVRSAFDDHHTEPFGHVVHVDGERLFRRGL